jgi:hypothetical protein
MRTDIRVEPIRIQFKYPWSDDAEEVQGLVIRRIRPSDSNYVSPEFMDKDTPRPTVPEVKCVSVTWERIDDHRFLETSTWIPMI